MQVNPTGLLGLLEPQEAGTSPSETSSQNKTLFQEMLAEVNGQQHEADSQVRQLLLGKTDLHEAMLALEKANLSLRLLVQVRNKLVRAYEELSRMPV
ncbi:MAG: flagellar hook-basal body complex protein FliE [Thermodesulfobacteriota bacterium]